MTKVQVGLNMKQSLLDKVDARAELLGLDRMEFIRTTLSKEVMQKQEE